MLGAVSQIQQRRELRIEPLALLEMAQRFRELSLLLQVLSLSQLLVRRRSVLSYVSARCGRRRKRGEQNGSEQ